MFPCGFTIAALLIASGTAAVTQPTVTLATTYRVKVHPGEELTLNCGDGTNGGVVQFWHTPFGDVHTPSVHTHTHPQPVLLQDDGRLRVSNSSSTHSGLYYCLLRDGHTSTLRPFFLLLSKRSSREDPPWRSRSRWRRSTEVSHSDFTAAVVTSVLLTFLLGFSSGALSRTHVLRCLGAMARRMRLPRQRPSNMPDRGPSVAMITVRPMVHDPPSSRIDQSDTSLTPPTKPQRSFRQRQTEADEESRTGAYLESCEHVKEDRKEERTSDGLHLQGGEEGYGNEGEEGIGKEFDGFYLHGMDVELRTEKGEGNREEEEEGNREEEDEEEDKVANRKEKDEEENREEEEEEEEEEGNRKEKIKFSGFYLHGERESQSEEEEGEKKEKEGSDKKNDEEKGKDEEKDGGGKEGMEKEGRVGEAEGGDEKEEGREEEGDEEDEDTSSSCDSTTSEEEPPLSGAGTTRSNRRVIRLYQYDEDGRRYDHLPDPAPSEPAPAPRLKQRSLSLTRLNAIMSAASASPLDQKEEGEARSHFHMEI